MSLEFLSIILGPLLAIEAILFGVFGFLYSVYAMYSANADGVGKQAIRAPICNIIKSICFALVVLICINASLAIFSLYFLFSLKSQGLGSSLLVWGLGLSAFSIPTVSIWIYNKME